MAGYAKYADEAKKAAEVDFNWWKPDKEGESITGKVMYYGDGIGGKFNQKTIKIDDGAGHVWGRGVGAGLAIALEQASVSRDDIISIIYRGERPTKNQTTFKKFDVIVHERHKSDLPY